MKTIKQIIISILVTSILIGGVFTPLMVRADTITFPSETDSFAKTVYVEAIDKNKPFFDEILPQIRANIAENNQHSITKYYDALPVLDNPENFQGLGHTTYANINGKTVTAEAFYRYHNESSNDPNNGLGLLIYQCIEYKRAHPEEDVKITFSSYRTSVVASVCVIPESKYYGYMRSLYGTNYEEHGFVRISFMLAEAARMGIEVTLVNQYPTYAVSQYNPSKNKTQGRATLDYRTYYKAALKTACYNKYAQDKKVSDYMNFVAVEWAIGDKNYDMQHVKTATVSNYIATDGTEHGPSLFVSSANLDDNNYKGCNGNNGSQAGCIISDHDELYRVTYNYMQLMAKYKAQEDIYKLRKYVNETSQKQIQLIKKGMEDEIPKDEQIVYLGSETDKVFEMYFTPFGGSTDSWDIVNNPFCKYISKFAKSTDYIELYWNEYSFGTNYICRTTNKLIENAFCSKPNPKNKFSISMSRFDTSKIEQLRIGREIGACSIKDNTSIHSKDIYISYEENGVRHKVSLITSCNYVVAGMNYRTNSLIVINETDETGGNYYDIMSEKYTYGMVNNNLMIDPANLALKTGETFTAKVIYSGDKELTWSVENPDIAMVENGVITALKAGETKVFVTDGTSKATSLLKISDCLDCLYASSFSGNLNEQYIMSKNLAAAPVAFSAVVCINKSDLKSKNTIVGCEDSYGAGFSFYINKNGNPCLMFKEEDGTSNSKIVTFSNVDVATGKKVHLSLSYQDSSNASERRINCYVNGVWKTWIKPAPKINFTQPKYNTIIGGDYLNGNATYFPGEIYSVALWSAARSTVNNADEHANGIDVSNSTLMAGYNLERCESCMLNDLSKNDNDLEHVALWQDKKDVAPVEDFDYSFAVIGDTQTMCEKDPAAMESIYDWIVENKESEKIEYVMGLGDITDDSTDREWADATNFISKLNGVVPYSLTRGNHDDWDDFNRNLHNGFYETTIDGMMKSGDIELTDPEQPGLIETTLEDGSIGYITREEDVPEGGTVTGDLTNSYRYLTVGDVDYLIMTIDFAPNEEMLAWVDKVVEAHPTHRVIITTHAYMYRDGTTIDANDLYPPSYYSGYDNAQDGDDMWEKCFSKHKNIVMVLSGHDPWQHIVYRQDKGINGNLVTQMLIDPQYVDKNIGSTAMVAMLYFSNNSDTVTVRYYSVAKDCYGSVLSQFTVDLRERKDNENNDDLEGDIGEDDDDFEDENLGGENDDLEDENLGGENDDDDENNNSQTEDELDQNIPQSSVTTYVPQYIGAKNEISKEPIVKVDVSEKEQITEDKQPDYANIDSTTKISATAGSKSVSLKWSKIKGAKKYKIYKYDTKTKKYKCLKTTTKLSFKISKLKSASTYKFKVKAYSKNGKLLDTTKICTVKTKPVAPTLKAKSKTKGTVTISWSKVKNAKGYQVYYSSSKNGKFKKLGDYNAKELTAKLKELKSGKNYYIKVRSYTKLSNTKVYSSFGKVKKVKVK